MLFTEINTASYSTISHKTQHYCYSNTKKSPTQFITQFTIVLQKTEINHTMNLCVKATKNTKCSVM